VRDTDQVRMELDFLEASDARHGNAANPAERLGAFNTREEGVVYPCSTGAEVYRGLGRFTVRVRDTPSTTGDVVGKIPADAVIEVFDKTEEDRSGQVWFKIGIASGYGWVITRSLPPHFRFEELFEKVPEHFVDRGGDESSHTVADKAGARLAKLIPTRGGIPAPPRRKTRASPPSPQTRLPPTDLS